MEPLGRAGGRSAAGTELRLPVLLAVVAVGGALGALGRHLLSVAVPTAPGELPWATLLTNLSGCLALGLLAGARSSARWLRPFLGPGVLGGFTTVSAFAVESDHLLVDAPLLGIAYVGLSLVGGLGLAAAGQRWTRR